MPEYFNPHNYEVCLIGPGGETVKIRGKHRKNLPAYFERYISKGYIKKAEAIPVNDPREAVTPKRQTSRKQSKPVAPTPEPQPIAPKIPRRLPPLANQSVRPKKTSRHAVARPEPQKKTPPKKIVGRQVNENAKELLSSNLKTNCYPISNGIGVGILSYNRGGSLRRLVGSIRRYTDLRRTTIFVSDDGSADPDTRAYLVELSASPDFVVINNQHRLGVAGNTNRLMACLARFPHALLLNDDVEVTASGWDNFYSNAFGQGGFHHFCYREPGVYGAQVGQMMDIGLHRVNRVDERPHGAVMAYTNKLFRQIGFFDQGFGVYGMEHVDWSTRAGASGLQPAGFFDLHGSQHYFKIHPEPSAVADRQAHLAKGREYLATVDARRGYINSTAQAAVPTVSCVIPCRDAERSGAIPTVINGVRAQRFPAIEIILVEHDTQQRVPDSALVARRLLVQSNGRPFNKAKAFNAGVAAATHQHLILHDADMIVRGDYVSSASRLLQDYDGCHLGKTVIYLTPDATHVVNQSGVLDADASFERAVGYFEGGSLACRRSTYWKIGGFNEDFWGYGVEDCDFFERLSKNCRWTDNRTYDFVHMWHGRTSGWQDQHVHNKVLGAQIASNPMPNRIAQLHSMLVAAGYGHQLSQALNGQMS